MDIRLTGRNALITGGSKGIGLAIARTFAEAGADVAIMARGQAALDAAVTAIGARQGQQVFAQSCDVSRADDIATGFAKVTEALGDVDILVNNAGTSQAHPFETVTDADWQTDLDLKLFAAIRLIRLAWPGMKQRRWGRIINVLNTGAKAPRPASVPTSVSRAAGMALTKALAGEGAPHGILVNGLLVGFIESDQWVQRAAKLGVPLEELLTKLGKEVPIGRVGTAQEFANVACFLASDAASYVTGTAINVDGNRCPVV
jgi:NAD(P)-dependent dehydrogenase (short-subunit alcohol dehydrogenase family)